MSTSSLSRSSSRPTRRTSRQLQEPRRRIPLSFERCEDRLPPGQVFGFFFDPIGDLLFNPAGTGTQTSASPPALVQTDRELLAQTMPQQAGLDLSALTVGLPAPISSPARQTSTEEAVFANAAFQGGSVLESPFAAEASPATRIAILAAANAQAAPLSGGTAAALINQGHLVAAASPSAADAHMTDTANLTRAQLAALVGANSDAVVNLRGTLQVLSPDDGHGGDGMIYNLEVNGQEIPLVTRGPMTDLLNGSEVIVQGEWVDGGLATTRQQIQVLSEPTLNDGRLQVRSILVISFNFQDRPGTPWTLATVNNVYNNQIATWYYDSSYSNITIYAHAIGWFTIPTTSTACNYSQWATMAQTAARGVGYEPNNFNHVVYAFPQVPACGWSGLGQVPGRFTWLNNAMSHGVAAHELGHNLGLFHSHSSTCNAGPLDGTCTFQEYGDSFDTMGAAGVRAAHHASYRIGVNWLSTSEGVVTLTPTLGNEYVEAITSAETWWGPRVLRVPRMGRNDAFYIEWREPVGVDSVLSQFPALNTGVNVYYDTGTTSRRYTEQTIVDYGYTTATRADAPVPYGQALVDFAGNLVIYPIYRQDGVSYIYVRYGI